MLRYMFSQIYLRTHVQTLTTYHVHHIWHETTLSWQNSGHCFRNSLTLSLCTLNIFNVPIQNFCRPKQFTTKIVSSCHSPSNFETSITSLFLTSIILDAKHEKIVGSNQDFFFRSHLKVSA